MISGEEKEEESILLKRETVAMTSHFSTLIWVKYNRMTSLTCLKKIMTDLKLWFPDK